MQKTLKGVNMIKQAKRIIEAIHEVTCMDDVQAGFPDANGNTNVTWCNRALHRMLVILSGDVSLLLEPRGINWTNANAMFKNLKERAEKIADGKTAQSLANDGNLIAAAAPNAAGPGHVALVCPDEYLYTESKGARIGQAGARTGFMYLKEGFAHLASAVEYFLIPYVPQRGENE